MHQKMLVNQQIWLRLTKFPEQCFENVFILKFIAKNDDLSDD